MVGSLLRGFYSISGARAARIGLHLLITPIIVRLLGPAYGDYAFIISIWAMLLVVTEGGVFMGLRKFIAEDRTSQRIAEAFGFYTTATAVYVLLVALAGSLLILLGVADTFGGQFVTYTVLLVLLVGSSSFMTLVRSALMGFRREVVSESLFALQMLIMAVVGLSLAYLGWGVRGLLIGHVVGTVVVLAAMVRYLSQEISITHALRSRGGSTDRTFISFSTQSILLLLLMASLYHLDILLVRLLLGQEATAVYKAALLAAEFLWVVPIALQQLLLHSSAELWAANKDDSIQKLAAQVTRYSLVLTALLGVGIAVLAEEFVGFYFGPGFAPAVLPMLILLPGAFGFALARGILSIGQGKGEVSILNKATGGAAVLNLVLNLILIPRIGLLGAAVATSIAYGSMLLFHVVAAHRIGFAPLADLRLVPTAITTVITGLLLLATKSVLPSDALALVVVPPIGLMAFSVLAIKTGALDVEEIRVVTGGVFPVFDR